ncbi:MAG: hypothetical protein JWP42_1006 [Pseudomonas sp.]|nr:hypothetical protein [Pseudomonas sp.]
MHHPGRLRLEGWIFTNSVRPRKKHLKAVIRERFTCPLKQTV